ncbi:MAG: 16S rRNA (cytidine(1402)-2'-O)-methyltransferase [Anaerolineales bacterium]|nr:16S rRNA (cytidine(1402)-2'-O)-methyltransferase [Anaerolineales bacterium]
MGTLYLVATPIGNLDDVTLRALKVLSEADLVAAEDTRHTRKLLQHHGVHASVVSYHEHNKMARMDEILRTLDTGDVALVSDAGTPALSDPGHDLVKQAWATGHRVSPVPGPSAPVAALVTSGLPTDRFLYLGYLPRGSKDRVELLKSRARDPWTLVAFEVPHRLQDSLADCEEAFGPDREAAICRELTKVHEEVVRGTFPVLRERFREVEPRGEVTVVIDGAPDADARWDESTVRAAVEERLADGDPPSTVAREIAKLAGWRRRDVYEMTLEDS